MSAFDLLESAQIGPRTYGLNVDGAWRAAEGGKTFVVVDPADGSELARVADASVADAKAALDAAVAQTSWAATPSRDRGEILRRAFELINARADDLAELMSLEMGKPLHEAKGEVVYGNEFFRWFSEEAVRIHGRWVKSPAGNQHFLTVRKPVGPCYFITPWNFPLAMGTRKIGPAIAAGCTMVVKPAELTPLTMLALAVILKEAGLPDGVLNVVPTASAAAQSVAVMDDFRLRKVSFTGSTPVGKLLMKQAANQLQRVSMELGGNAPFVVFEDADVDQAIEGAMVAKMRNMGEACTAANRFFVHESVADEFSAKLASRMAALTIGRGQKPGTDVGPLIEEKAVVNVSRLVDEAVTAGATLVTGGRRPEGPGFFYEPTVITNVPATTAIASEEIFGPVAAITTFASEDEVVARANDTEFGLASYVFTKDVARVMRLSESLQYGMVGVNTGLISNPAAPFGGVKASGFGREGGFEGIDEYLSTTYVNLPLV